MITSGGGALLYSVNRRDAAVLRNLENLPPEYGLPDMNAALAVVHFREAAKGLLKRREIARLYTQSALRTRHKRFIQPDALNQPVEYNNYAFPLILETGVKDVKAYARRKEIAVESAFENTLIGSGIAPPEKCPEAYSLSLRTVLFPIYPRLSIADAGKVAKLIQTLP
jgi:dTDP-4-amino-4,6-dideoxygalactose transaminase